MPLDWSILRTSEPVDIAGNFTQGYKIGSALMDKFHERNALAALAQTPNDPSALATLYQVNPTMGEYFQKRGTELASRRVAATAAQQYAGGDTKGAQATLLASGQADLAKQYGDLGEADRKKAADVWTAITPLAYQLRQEPDPQKRVALYNAAKPELQAMGADSQMLANFDPTNNTALDAVIATGQKVGDLITQNKPEYKSIEAGGSLIDVSGGNPRVVIAPNDGSHALGAPVAASGPVGVSPAAASVASTLSSAGLPAPVVAGFMGNFHVEGGYDGAQGDGGSASGIAQWHNDRAATFQRVIGKPVTAATPAEQAQFVAWEMKNPEAAGMTVAQRDAILAAKTPAEAAALIDQHYERSSGRDRQVRMAAATAYAGDAGGAPVHAVSQSEFAALPSGAHFIALDDPTHTVRVKP